MNRISITVDQTNQALMLVDWLKDICFVQEVNIVYNLTLVTHNSDDSKIFLN